jgi:glycogen operon protein
MNGSLLPSRPQPLGAHLRPDGIHFALWAPHATQVWLVLFDAGGTEQLARLALPGCEHGVWHGFLPGGQAGLLYGYRVDGPWAPALGHRFNPNKVLLDPYAREVVGRFDASDPACFDFQTDNPNLPCPLDNAKTALKGRVLDPHYDWQGDAPPAIASADTILYECHVKGFTQCWPDLPEAVRGSYAALAEPAVLDYLQQLGITSLSLLPIHYHCDEVRLQQLGLSNYWGYNTIGFFAPETRYWSGRPGTTPCSELKDAIRALHGRGIEVLLDVVYNHSAEGDEQGPTLSLRGIANQGYYHLLPGQPGQPGQAEPGKPYLNLTGCGNSINLGHPRVLQWVLDSLRYWVDEFHVDGFRFDLAPVLGRISPGAADEADAPDANHTAPGALAPSGGYDASGIHGGTGAPHATHAALPPEFSRAAPFFSAILQDPLLSQIKLIAEPWDIGPNGYQLGQFPAGWLEWNDQYRDTMRAFWLHQWPTLGEFARRFAASSDLFQTRQRQPAASVNFICAHDGFTLADLVSYNHKHNLANGEHNRDGHNHNHSWNGGVEGPTLDPALTALRQRLQRALLATLLFSQGTPMLLAGDEMGNSQQGNNNAYCQDNPTSWLTPAEANPDMVRYVARLIALRRQFPALRRNQWFAAKPNPQGDPLIDWLTPHGQPMQEHDWHSRERYAIAMLLHDPGQACLLLCNAEAQPVSFTLPVGNWQHLLDSSVSDASGAICSGQVTLAAHSLWLACSATTTAAPVTVDR